MVVRIKDTGDLLASTAQTIVNTVNCRGVMGKGVAAAFRDSGVYNEMVAEYEKKCAAGEVKLGRPYLWRPDPPTPDSEQGILFDGETLEFASSLPVKHVLNFPTKDHWKQRQSRLSDIDKGLSYAADQNEEWKIKSMAVPALGCGNGRLNWDLIRPTLLTWLEERFPTVEVELHAPPDGVGEPGRIKLGWIDMAEAMAAAGERLAGQDMGVSTTVFSKVMAAACFEFPDFDGVRPDFFGQVRKRLVNNGVIGYECDPTEGRSLDVSVLLAPGPTFKTSIDWRREQGDPDKEAIRVASKRLIEEIDRRATSRAR